MESAMIPESICDNYRDLSKDKNLIQFFVDAIESKDPYTQGHSHHVRAITEAIFDSLPIPDKLEKENLNHCHNGILGPGVITMLITESHKADILGQIACYDRVVINGVNGVWGYDKGMTSFFYSMKYKIFDFHKIFAPITDQITANAENLAKENGMKIEFIRKASAFRKDDRIDELLAEVEIIPAQVKVIEHVREIYACRHCEQNAVSVPVIKAEAPEPVIKGSVASPSSVAHIMVQKYVNAMPLYRQCAEFVTMGLVLSRQTAANWMIYCAEHWLKPLYELMRSCLLKEETLHADETSLQVPQEPGRASRTQSYMWLYMTGVFSALSVVLYEYRPTRSGSHPKRFPEGFKGYPHTDGYVAYHKSAAGYRERYNARLERSKPVFDAMYAWAGTVSALPKSLLGHALHYLFEQRPYLENFYLDGRLELSNNRAERSIKPFVIGGKNWLFSATPKGAEASSIIYSIIETAKANKLKPFEYLKYIFKTIPNISPDRYSSLPPWSETLPDCCKLDPTNKE